MAEKKVEVIISTGSGVELRIKGDRQTVQDIVAEIHRREETRARFREDFMKRRTLEHARFAELTKRRNAMVHGKVIEEHIPKTNPKTKTTIFLELVKERFFGAPKTINDIQRALQQKGYYYPLTTLSPTLLRLVRRGILTRSRNEEKGLWEYKSG